MHPHTSCLPWHSGETTETEEELEPGLGPFPPSSPNACGSATTVIPREDEEAAV